MAMIWQLPDRPEQQTHDEAMSPESYTGEHLVRSPNLICDPAIILELYGDKHVRIAIARLLQQREPSDPQAGVMEALEHKYML